MIAFSTAANTPWRDANQTNNGSSTYPMHRLPAGTYSLASKPRYLTQLSHIIALAADTIDDFLFSPAPSEDAFKP